MNILDTNDGCIHEMLRHARELNAGVREVRYALHGSIVGLVCNEYAYGTWYRISQPVKVF